MTAQWQYLQDGQSIGPIDEQDLREMLASGELKPSTPIRCTDLGEASWRPAKSVPEFKALFTATAVSVVPSAAESPIAVVEAPKPSFEVSRPIVVSIATSGPIEAITAREEGANVVKWMWRFAFAAWAVCFLPIPGLSTFLVWLFAAVSGTLAFVALFKNRVGAGIGCSIALLLVTPAVWFFSLWLYAMLLGKSIIDAEQAAQTRHRSAQNQTAVQNAPKRNEDNELELRTTRAIEIANDHNGDLAELARLIDQGVELHQVYSRSFDGSDLALKHYVCFASIYGPQQLEVVKAVARKTQDFNFACSANGTPAWSEFISVADPEISQLFNSGLQAWSNANGDKRFLHYLASRAIQLENALEILVLLLENGLDLSSKDAYFCQVEHYPGSRATDDIPSESYACYNALISAVEAEKNDLARKMLTDWNAYANIKTDDASYCKTVWNQSNEEMKVLLPRFHATERCPENWQPDMKYRLIGSWQDENSVCTYFADTRLICDIAGKRVERTWRLNSRTELEWLGGSQRYVYLINEAYSNKMLLENLLPENARGKRWTLSRALKPESH